MWHELGPQICKTSSVQLVGHIAPGSTAMTPAFMVAPKAFLGGAPLQPLSVGDMRARATRMDAVVDGAPAQHRGITATTCMALSAAVAASFGSGRRRKTKTPCRTVFRALSAKTIEVVKATAPVVAPNASAITADFYPRLLNNNPAAWAFFNKTNQKKGLQQQALADAVVGFASNIDNLGVLEPVVNKMAHRHCALGVTPELYQLVHDTLMASIGEVLGDAVTPEIGGEWSNAVMALAEICITSEENLYKTAEGRAGGWRGYKDFTLVKKHRVGTDTVSFDFAAVDQPGAAIEFTPGQYLTIRCPDLKSEAPRHYTVTNKPGDSFLQCTTRHVHGSEDTPAGVVSSYMHTQLEEGDTVQLAPPFGVFTKANALANVGDVKFVTAGIGLTLAKSLSQPGGVKTAGLLHVDRSDNHTADMVKTINAGFVSTVYGKSRGEIMSAIKEYGAAASDSDTFILCGPVPFMRSAKDTLQEAGAQNIQYELFGTGSMK